MPKNPEAIIIHSMNTTSKNPLESLWQHAAGQNYPKSTLYVVATPIGNLSDITIRALHILGLCDAIACEDTRHSKPLLQQYGIQKPLLAVHDHNEDEVAQSLINRLHAGERIALISDAGTPAISDPGARVVAAVRAAGLTIVPLAGANAAITAMSAAGLEGSFLFAGFLSNKTQTRQNQLINLAEAHAHLIFYEAPHRLHASIEALAEAFPRRDLIIVKELSKLHEKITRYSLANTHTWLTQMPPAKGEYLLIVSAPLKQECLTEDAWLNTLTILLNELPLKQAVSLTVQLTGASKNQVYSHALSLKNDLIK